MKRIVIVLGVVLAILLLTQSSSSTPQVEARTCVHACLKGFTHVLPGYYYFASTTNIGDPNGEQCYRVRVTIWRSGLRAQGDGYSGYASAVWWTPDAQWWDPWAIADHEGWTHISWVYRSWWCLFQP